jgi:hypothetical protein
MIPQVKNGVFYAIGLVAQVLLTRDKSQLRPMYCRQSVGELRDAFAGSLDASTEGMEGGCDLLELQCIVTRTVSEGRWRDDTGTLTLSFS